MTLEESKEVIPMLESMINHIEEQQELMTDMYQEIQERDKELLEIQGQAEYLQKLNCELLQQLEILPSIEEVLELLEKQNVRIQDLEIEKNQIEKLENQNQEWQQLAERLNKENNLLQEQNNELLSLNNN